MFGILMAVEFVDEFEFGLREAAWLDIRTDLDMSYLLVGLVLGLPGVIIGPFESVLGILGDTKHRKRIMVAGGFFFALAVLLMAAIVNGWMLLGVTVLFFPSSFALVGLGQATLMDTNPARTEQNMARWTFAGSVGIVLGLLSDLAIIPLIERVTGGGGEVTGKWRRGVGGALGWVLLLSGACRASGLSPST